MESHLDFDVVLEVLAPTTQVKPEPEPAGLIFFTHKAAPGSSQTVLVHAGSSAPVPYQASVATAQGADWLSVSPSTGSASSGTPGSSIVVVNPNGLPAGVYRGGVSYAFSSEAVRTVNVTLIVAQAAGDALGALCSPTALIPTHVGLTHNFQQPTGWPTPLAVKLLSDCGAPVNGGQVTASFSNGDPPLALQPVDTVSGVYIGTWTPRNASPQVSIAARSTGMGLPESTAEIVGQVAASTLPILALNGALQIYEPTVGAPLAPGSVARILGVNLASATTQAVPGLLPATLSDTAVFIGGIPAPLYSVSPEQITVQVPLELQPGRPYQVQVTGSGGRSTAESVQLDAVAPNLAARDNGEALAQHSDFTAISESSPARPGERITIYLVGLGHTDRPLSSGQLAPQSPLLHPEIRPVLNFGGSAVTIDFAGLSPGSVGLYQINFAVPPETPDGKAELFIEQGNSRSNRAYLNVHR